jgi:hypothetical protein
MHWVSCIVIAMTTLETMIGYNAFGNNLREWFAQVLKKKQNLGNI